jgi:hypothetical protein
MHNLSRRFWLETVLAAACAVLFFVTLLWHDWIEIVFRVDPDHGNGSLEWLFVAALGVAAVTCSILARHEWRRLQEAT